jgi:serine O-acetyltransferase
MDKKLLREIINSDLYRYLGKSSFLTFVRAFKFPGFKYSYFLRKCFFYKNQGSKVKYLFFKLFLRKYTYKFGFDIPPDCNIGKGLYIGHFGRVIIHEDAEIGCNVNISPGVTIGQTNRGKNKGVPKIGNNVWIGTNAIIVGKIQIGNNVLIAPGAFINFGVPDNAVVIGNPGKIVSYKGTEEYVCKRVE